MVQNIFVNRELVFNNIVSNIVVICSLVKTIILFRVRNGDQYLENVAQFNVLLCSLP